ncbi:Hypp538 [Branchiostoma lanceolatum]|nr:Hypp538 [Branchiostoma lanceolatum]
MERLYGMDLAPAIGRGLDRVGFKAAFLTAVPPALCARSYFMSDGQDAWTIDRSVDQVETTDVVIYPASNDGPWGCSADLDAEPDGPVMMLHNEEDIPDSVSWVAVIHLEYVAVSVAQLGALPTGGALSHSDGSWIPSYTDRMFLQRCAKTISGMSADELIGVEFHDKFRGNITVAEKATEALEHAIGKARKLVRRMPATTSVYVFGIVGLGPTVAKPTWRLM